MAGPQIQESVTVAGRAERARVARAFAVGVLGPGRLHGLTPPAALISATTRPRRAGDPLTAATARLDGVRLVPTDQDSG